MSAAPVPHKIAVQFYCLDCGMGTPEAKGVSSAIEAVAQVVGLAHVCAPQQRFCVDCKHARLPLIDRLLGTGDHRCRVVTPPWCDGERRALVDGRGMRITKDEQMLCISARSDHGECGPDAKLWERKP